MFGFFQKKNGDKRAQILTKQFKTRSTALSLFLQSAGSLALGLLMWRNDSLFLASVTQLIFLYFVFVISVNFIRIGGAFHQGLQAVWFRFLLFLASIAVTFFVWRNIQDIYTIIPIALSLWLMILSISNFISFMQYHGEKSVASFRYVVAAVGDVVFAMLFVVNTDNRVSASLHILGIYLVILGASRFLDFLGEVLPKRFLNQMKRRVHIAPPMFITLMLPQNLLDSINACFVESEEVPDVFRAENPPRRPEDGAVNLELFIHVSKSLSGTAGHIDLALDGTIYCYGAYDKQQSKKYGGVAGEGVVYEVADKAAYLNFCKTKNNETVFAFGLRLQEDELDKIREKLAELKARSYPWRCPAQCAAAQGEPTDVYTDFPSRMASAIEVSFYKFKSGSYKYYWILGTNCVSFVDDLLRASGMQTMLAGVITPGSYYAFLNTEFLKENSVVIKREVYTKAIDQSMEWKKTGQ